MFWVKQTLADLKIEHCFYTCLGDILNQVLTFKNFVSVYVLYVWPRKAVILLNKIFDDRKTFGRHLVFSTSRISANILLVASQSDCGILSIY